MHAYVCVQVCEHECRWPQRPAEGVRSLGVGAADGYDPSSGCLESNSGSLKE